MEQQDELFQLIRALTKSEKKFFTQYVNIYEKGSAPIYLRLFEYLNEEEIYDEEKIFKKFREPNFRKNYPVTKHYLKNLILKTLRHSDLSVREDRDLTVFMLDIKRLMAKGLFAMAKKMIERMKDEARDEEKWHDFIHLIGMQRSLYSLGYYRHEPALTLDALDEEEEAALDKMKQLRQVMNSAIQLYSLMHYEQSPEPAEVQKQIHHLSKQKILQHYDQLLSAKAKHTFLQFWTQYYGATGDYGKYAEFANKKMAFVTSEKLPPGPAINWKILAHNHCLSADMLTSDFSSFSTRLDYLQQLDLKSGFHEAERFQTLSLFGILFYLKNYDEQKLNQYIQYSIDGLKNYAPFIRRVFVYTLRTTIAFAYLKLKKLDDCWREVNELMTLTNGESRKDYVGHLKIINLMLRFEMKEYNYVSYLLKNTYRFFMYYLYTSPVHKFMISYLKEALKTTNQKSLEELNNNYLLILRRLQFQPTEADMALVIMVEDFLGRNRQ